MVWAAVGALLTLALGLIGKRGRPVFSNRWPLAIAAGLISVAVVYGRWSWSTGCSWWISASGWWRSSGSALIRPSWPCLLADLHPGLRVTARTLLARIPVSGESNTARYAAAVLALSGGFALLLGLDYAALFLTGRLPTAFDPLSTVVAIQFLPLTALIAVISVFTWKRTGGYAAASVICGTLLTWYMWRARRRRWGRGQVYSPHRHLPAKGRGPGRTRSGAGSSGRPRARHPQRLRLNLGPGLRRGGGLIGIGPAYSPPNATSPAKAGAQIEPGAGPVLASAEGASSPKAQAGSGPRPSPGKWVDWDRAGL
ncbi:hypothetical protein CSW58_13155 [Caulobacter sp. B11]|uniref:hypothetical protein n=1 Tax=Caulobacter sp. B11 TaxID=2048899 RepID=UPI000C131833|nr:hypothetical protein [Caulobacter sp. B11]PHY12362.1 hypothetical protein CSW58_13155 [Caulobacter sp. B11]